uniref:Nif11 domain-containing protein n=1 Tax=Chlorobium chlorochromatii (strain CaD3) TaxID=340177 RepID=Q3AT41_CHLCH
MPQNDAKRFVEKLRADDGYRGRIAEIMRYEGYSGTADDLKKLTNEEGDDKRYPNKSYCSSLSWHQGDKKQQDGASQGYHHWAG